MAVEQIASRLLAPNTSSETNSETNHELLLDSKPLQEIALEYKQSNKEFDDVMQAATQVSQLVRQTLNFASTDQRTPLLTAESLAERRATNCFGYTLVTSECLEKIGVPHYVSYANQHTFVTAIHPESQRLLMIDPTSSYLTCELTEAVGGKSPADQLQSGEVRAFNGLYAEALLKQLPPEINRLVFTSSHPWLTFTNQDTTSYVEPRPSDMRLQMISMLPEEGRRVLLSQYNAIIYHNQGDLEEAAKCMRQLSGEYLDIDSRNRLKQVKKMVKDMLRYGLWREALRTAHAVDQSLNGDESMNRLFLPDVMRAVAVKLGSVGLMMQAIESYQGLPEKVPLRQKKLAAAQTSLGKLV